MRSAIHSSITYSGTKVQTWQIYNSDRKLVESNFDAVLATLKNLELANIQKQKSQFSNLENSFLFRNVGHESILQLLDCYKVPGENHSFNAAMIQNYILELVKLDQLTDWSVALMSQKTGSPISFGPYSVNPYRRTVRREVTEQNGRSSVILRSVSTPGEELIDLADKIVPRVAATELLLQPKDGPSKSETQVRLEFRPKERGLLMIYPLISNSSMPDIEYMTHRDDSKATFPLRGVSQLFALSMVFPESTSPWGRGGYMRNKTV